MTEKNTSALGKDTYKFFVLLEKTVTNILSNQGCDAERIANQVVDEFKNTAYNEIIYMGTGRGVKAIIRNNKMLDEFTGNNISDLCDKYQMSSQSVYRILKTKKTKHKDIKLNESHQMTVDIIDKTLLSNGFIEKQANDLSLVILLDITDAWTGGAIYYGMTGNKKFDSSCVIQIKNLKAYTRSYGIELAAERYGIKIDEVRKYIRLSPSKICRYIAKHFDGGNQAKLADTLGLSVTDINTYIEDNGFLNIGSHVDIKGLCKLLGISGVTYKKYAGYQDTPGTRADFIRPVKNRKLVIFCIEEIRQFKESFIKGKGAVMIESTDTPD